MPQPGHGKPVSILKGQNDWSVSRWWSLLLRIKKNGIESVNIAPTIP